jgi:hypothetical protein
VEQRLLELVERGELLLVDGGETLGFGETDWRWLSKRARAFWRFFSALALAVAMPSNASSRMPTIRRCSGSGGTDTCEFSERTTKTEKDVSGSNLPIAEQIESFPRDVVHVFEIESVVHQVPRIDERYAFTRSVRP